MSRKENGNGNLKGRRKYFETWDLLDGSGDAELFLVRLETIARTYEWSEGDKLANLVAALHGDAEQLLITCKGQVEYEQLAEKLRQRFSTRIEPELARLQLRRRKQHKSETLQELAADIERLAAMCAPRLPAEECDRCLGLPSFLDALNDDRLRLELGRKGFNSVGDALKEALYLQSWTDIRSRRFPESLQESADCSGSDTDDSGIQAPPCRVHRSSQTQHRTVKSKLSDPCTCERTCAARTE